MDATGRDELDRVLRDNPYLEFLGAELEDWGPGWARVSAKPRAEQANIVGTVHGGILTGLADIAFEVACNSYGRVCVAVELTAHFAEGVGLGEKLVAECTEVSRSKRLASYRIDVTASERPIAHFLALAYRTNRWHVPQEDLPKGYADEY